MVTVRKTRSDHVRENRRPDTKCKGAQEASLDQGGGKGRGASSVGGRRGRRKTRIDREAEQTFLPAIACGRNGLFVIDCDRHGGPDGVEAFKKLVAANGGLPRFTCFSNSRTAKRWATSAALSRSSSL